MNASSITNLAFLNARSVNDITLNEWLKSDYSEVRQIAALELVRRHVERYGFAEQMELVENTGFQDGPALYVKSNGKTAKVEYSPADEDFDGGMFLIFTNGELWTSLPDEQAGSIAAEIVLATK